MREITSVDLEDTVVCDGCGEDYTNSDECGGLLVVSHAYCPKCAPQMEQGIKKHNEEHTICGRCPEGKPYRKWVLEDLRKGNNKIIIEAFPVDMELSIPCQVCQKVHKFTVKAKDYQDWVKGKYAQDAFPYLFAAQREMLISKTCPTCFDDMFKEPEEDSDA
jgi:hypothetical protein